ncbi:MAG TPA: alpha/beta hydrolase [Bryobacteraceae bacterium]|nr:alpha/beta hydrolase [Bryobacteraceae bacterium]
MDAVRFALAVSLAAAPAFAADAPAKDAARALHPANYNIPLWDAGKVPMAAGSGPLDAPFLTVFLPPPGKGNGAAVVVAPGGSDIMLMYGAEGMNVAERFNDWGVAAFVLTYRLSPRYNESVRVMEGKRAIQVVRAHAEELKLDPRRVGYIGFSAGGNMGRSVVATSGAGDPNAEDPVDRLSSRPDYVALVYGPGNARPGENLKNFPPTFLAAAAGDSGPAVGSAQLFTELVRAGAVAEIHVYQRGHHGFGDGYASPNFEDWMPRLQHFLEIGGFIPGGRQ